MQINDQQEYKAGIKRILESYVRRIEQQEAGVWQMGEYVVRQEVLEKYFGIGCGWYNYFAEEIQSEKEIEEILGECEKLVCNYIIPFDYRPRESFPREIEKHLWYTSLKEYRGRDFIYVSCEEQLEKVKTFLEQRQKPIVLLAEFEISDDIDLPDCVVVITLVFTGEGRFTNIFLESNFPLIFHYFNLFDLLVELLQPKEILMIEEIHFQEEIWKEMGRVNKIPFKLLEYV